MEFTDRMTKGQSAIEYLMTYGWMLLVVAIVGGAIFATIQDQTSIETTGGLANADTQIQTFATTGDALEMEIIGAGDSQLEDVSVMVFDESEFNRDELENFLDDSEEFNGETDGYSSASEMANDADDDGSPTDGTYLDGNVTEISGWVGGDFGFATIPIGDSEIASISELEDSQNVNDFTVVFFYDMSPFEGLTEFGNIQGQLEETE